jgi:uncharacterized membrane protein (DUF2068 family)
MMKMSIGSRLKIDNRSMFATSAFYAVAGIVFLVLLASTGFAPHLGIIGIFSLVAAYGLFTKKAWTIWFVIILFFVATTFSAFTIYYFLGTDYFLGTGAIVYVVLTWVFTAYTLTKRRMLEA